MNIMKLMWKMSKDQRSATYCDNYIWIVNCSQDFLGTQIVDHFEQFPSSGTPFWLYWAAILETFHFPISRLMET